jgi:hypothetical protein
MFKANRAENFVPIGLLMYFFQKLKELFLATRVIIINNLISLSSIGRMNMK